MQTVSTFDQLPAELHGRKSCLTIGVFDGVHLGHQELLNKTVQTARRADMVPVALTFSNHPLSVLAPPYTPQRLVTSSRKADLLRQIGIEILLMLDFTEDFAAIAPESFVSDFLVDKASIGCLVCGYDFTFGNHGAGDIDLLKNMGLATGFTVENVQAVSHDKLAVKSTHIRDLLSGGNVSAAASLLTRPHELPGVVKSGMRRGRTIGFPTANLRVADKFQTPAGGVYVCAARIGMENELLPAMVNIGTNPTFGENEMAIEAHIIGFDREIHGQQMSLYFLKRIRDERKFPGPDALIEQLHKDHRKTESLWDSSPIREMLSSIPGPVDHELEL